jgi:Leucine-rich repeat (LRR) protein
MTRTEKAARADLERLAQSLGPDARVGVAAEADEVVSVTIRHSRLTAVPDSIGALKGLRRLNLSENALEVLPASLGDLSCLEVLDLGHNKLTGLPATFAGLKRLEVLYLSNNQTTASRVRRGRTS